MIAFASSLDQAGPMARSAEDCALLLSSMAASTSAMRPASTSRPGLPRPDAGRDGATAAQPLKGLRIGLPKEFFPAGLTADVNAAVRQGLSELEKLGATSWM